MQKNAPDPRAGRRAHDPKGEFPQGESPQSPSVPVGGETDINLQELYQANVRSTPESLSLTHRYTVSEMTKHAHGRWPAERETTPTGWQ